ncbi:glycosyltransferase family 2 protein [[Ruminococcus] lactaris]|uniref:glycosyltransferase family 2 protein n=1 Tax=[Ruminococcus] lactaris TaxID=46228 RepID=UPI0032C0433A
MLKFSVIVPIYKVEQYINECIDSVINQTYSNWELILVDDGSPDNCPKICDEYADKDRRIKVVHKKNSGLPAARNTGIRIATGEYFMHLDGDDFWDLNYLATIEPIVRKDPKDLYLGNSRFDYINGESQKEILYKLDDVKSKSYSEMIHQFFEKNNYMPTAAMHNIYSTQFVRENNLYLDETLTWSEDADNFYRLIFSTKNIGFFDYTFYYYRKDNVGAMTKNPSLRHFLSNVVVTKRWFEFINHSNMEENDKKVILTRFANSYIYNLKNIYCLSKDEYTIIAEKMLGEQEMMKYVSGFPCKYIYYLTKIIGKRNTSKLLNYIKR